MTDTIVQQTPADLISQAIDKGLTVEALEKLMSLQERWEANQARKLFFEAFTNFQSECPDLRRTKEVDFTTSKGGNVKYKYAPLADITRQLAKVLKANELSYRWEIQDDEKIKVTCLVSHINGHTERTTMTASPDDSGSKNSIQARGSTIEYLKRYTLIGALGLSTADSDIDGRLPQQVDLEKLHNDYMDVYGQVIQLDSSLSKYHPDNWKLEPTPKVYLKAVGELRKILFDLQQKKK